MEKLKVGQIVYLKPVGNNTRQIKGDNIINHIKEAEIEKVGKKYFHLKEWRAKFSLEEMRDVSNYIEEWKVYVNKQEIIDEEEFNKLSSDIKIKFGSYSKPNLTLDQLRRIKAIIDED